MSAHASPPIMVFDGECGFCTSAARFLGRWVVRGGSTSVAPSIEPWQQLNLAALGLTRDQCKAAVQWVGVGGQVASGHEAIAAVLRSGHPVWRPVGALLVTPGFTRLAARLYSWVADHRTALPGGTPACRAERPSGQ